MAGTITHEWNGSVLTITSDSGTSSADLLGPVGDTGCRGPQGPAGIVYDNAGNIVLDLADYATTDYVDRKVDNVEVDLSDYSTAEQIAATYATQNYVSTEIAKAQLEGAGVDTSGFATKDDLANLDLDISVDEKTIVTGTDGKLRTAIGGYATNGGAVNYSATGLNYAPQGFWDGKWYYPPAVGNIGKPFVTDVVYDVSMTFKDGGMLDFKIMFSDVYPTGEMYVAKAYHVPTNIHITSFDANVDGSFTYGYKDDSSAVETILEDRWVLTAVRIYAPGHTPIDGNYIPVDGNTIYLNKDGKLSCSISIEGGTINLDNYYTKQEIDALFASGGGNLPSGEEVEY